MAVALTSSDDDDDQVTINGGGGGGGRGGHRSATSTSASAALSWTCLGLLTRTQRFLLGCVVLLTVVVIWVLSSELTKYIFLETEFDKPFFTTYYKTALFSVYLIGFAVAPSWRRQATSGDYQELKREAAEDGDDSAAELGGPTYIPVKTGGEAAGDDVVDQEDCRSVRFNRVVEVRELSPADAVEALMSRLSYAASLRAEAANRCSAAKLSAAETSKLAATFAVLFFAGSYSYQAALSHTEAGLVNVLSSTSGFFTLVMAACLPSGVSDQFTLSKLAAVLLSVAGVVIVSLNDVDVHQPVPVGAGWALAGAMFYAAYLVLLKRRVDDDEKLSIPMFFGFVGLFSALVMWPLFFVLDYTQLEVFQWPTRQQWLYITANGLIGTVLSEFLWLWGCFLTSSLTGTLALSLTIPLTMVTDVAVKRVSYPTLFYLGAVLVLGSFVVVTLLTHFNDWDPVGRAARRLRAFCCGRRRGHRSHHHHPRRPSGAADADEEQSQSLIDAESPPAVQVLEPVD